MTATRADHCPFSDPRSAAQALWMEDDPGFFGGERLISYDPGKMRTITACFVHRHLTLFASNEAFLMHAGWLAYAISLALILTYIDEDQKYSKVALGLFDGAMLEFRVLPHVVVSLSSSGSTTTSTMRESTRNSSIAPSKSPKATFCSSSMYVRMSASEMA